jgi:hypothetical protein
MLHDLHIRKEPLPRAKFNGAQKLAYTGVVVMGLGSLLTGLAIYKPVQLAWLTALFGGYPMPRASPLLADGRLRRLLPRPHRAGHSRGMEQLPGDGDRSGGGRMSDDAGRDRRGPRPEKSRSGSRRKPLPKKHRDPSSSAAPVADS